MSYKPSPIATEGVDFPPELLPLTEQLAQNAHDLWAAQRLAQGWRHGPQRDDAKKLHLCLVPYDQLPDSEKEYDRIAALGTLKAILTLGYSINPTAQRRKPSSLPATGSPTGTSPIPPIFRKATSMARYKLNSTIAQVAHGMWRT